MRLTFRAPLLWCLAGALSAVSSSATAWECQILKPKWEGQGSPWTGYYSGRVDSGFATLPAEFWSEFVRMADRLHAPPEELAKVIFAESRFDAGARNGVAKGLNQLTSYARTLLGMDNETWATYECAPVSVQLAWVEKFFRRVMDAYSVTQWRDSCELYLANFAPETLRRAHGAGTVIFREGTPEYAGNRGFDRPSADGTRKGYITVGDVCQSASNAGRQTAFIQQVLPRLRDGQARVLEEATAAATTGTEAIQTLNPSQNEGCN